MDANLDHLNDGELLQLLNSSGSGDAFAALYGRHGTMVFNVCHRVLEHSHDAEDATQAVFLTLAQKAESLRGQSSVASWLHHVAWCVACNIREALGVRKRREMEARERAGKTIPGREPWEQLRTLLDQELNALPENFRLPILLHYMEGRSVKESAERLGWSVGTFASRLSRGKEKLKRRLDRRGAVLSVGLLATLISDHASAAEPTKFLGTAAARIALTKTAGKALEWDMSSPQISEWAQIGNQILWLEKVKKTTACSFAALILLLGAGVLVDHFYTRHPSETNTGPQDKARNVFPGNDSIRRADSHDRPPEGRFPDGPYPNDPTSPDSESIASRSVSLPPEQLEHWDALDVARVEPSVIESASEAARNAGYAIDTAYALATGEREQLAEYMFSNTRSSMMRSGNARVAEFQDKEPQLLILILSKGALPDFHEFWRKSKVTPRMRIEAERAIKERRDPEVSASTSVFVHTNHKGEILGIYEVNLPIESIPMQVRAAAQAFFGNPDWELTNWKITRPSAVIYAIRSGMGNDARFAKFDAEGRIVEFTFRMP